MAFQKTEKKNFLHYLETFKVEKNFIMNENFHFLPRHIFRFSKRAVQKTEKMKFLHYLGVIEPEKNVFMNENFHFFYAGSNDTKKTIAFRVAKIVRAFNLK